MCAHLCSRICSSRVRRLWLSLIALLLALSQACDRVCARPLQCSGLTPDALSVAVGSGLCVRVCACAALVQSSIALSMSRQAWGDVEVLEQTHEWKCGDTKPKLCMVQPVVEEGHEARRLVGAVQPANSGADENATAKIGLPPVTPTESQSRLHAACCLEVGLAPAHPPAQRLICFCDSAPVAALCCAVLCCGVLQNFSASGGRASCGSARRRVINLHPALRPNQLLLPLPPPPLQPQPRPPLRQRSSWRHRGLRPCASCRASGG